MSHLMFVCTGNICRSPFAERLSDAKFRTAGRDEWTFSSTGTGALAGSPMDPHLRAELEARGGTANGFVSRQADLSLLREADLIIALEAGHRTWIIEESPSLARRTFTLGQAVRFCTEDAGLLRGAAFLEALSESHSRARGRDDVRDPYKRGEKAAAVAAHQIEMYLDALLPRLVEA